MRCFTRLSILAVAFFLCGLLFLDTAHAVVDAPNNPPEDPPFLGGYYVTGFCSLGIVTAYFPVSDGWCVDEYGFLFRYGSSNVTGVMYDSSGKEYSFNAPAFSSPRYRLSDGVGYSYTDLYLTPTYSNVVIEDSFAASLDPNYSVQLVILAAVGLILIVLVSKGR